MRRFFSRKSSVERYNHSVVEGQRDQGPTHAAKGKRSRLFTFNVDVDG